MESGALRLRGRVRSFRGAWGFITSDQFDGDLFVGLKSNPHLLSLAQDDEVEFEVKADARGKAEAMDVKVCGQDGLSGSGWVREFKGQWGFINSDAFTGDLFVGLKANPHLTRLQQGDQVDFEVRADDKGKQEAVNVRIRGAPPTPSAARMPASSQNPAERASAPHLLGQTLLGRIKSFKDQWGFVNSDAFTGDLFIHSRSNPGLGPAFAGDPVQFEMAQDTTSNTGFHAVNAMILKAEARDLIGDVVTGWVKSFKGSWGLLNSHRFDGDVFVGRNSNPQLGTLAAGDWVEFQIESETSSKNGNGVAAIQVRPIVGVGPPPVVAPAHVLASPTGPVATPSASDALGAILGAMGLPATAAATLTGGSVKLRPQQLSGSRCRGTVRSFREDWGFLVSDAFEGDLFVHAGSNPGLASLQAGDTVSFEIAIGQTGKPHAVGVQPAPAELQDLAGRACSGRIRSFSETWGFITSNKFSGDLFVGLRSNPHLTVPLRIGDEVEFTVQRSSSTKSSGSGFEAASVRIVSSGGASAGGLGVGAGVGGALGHGATRSSGATPTRSAGAASTRSPGPAPTQRQATPTAKLIDPIAVLQKAASARSRSPRLSRAAIGARPSRVGTDIATLAGYVVSGRVRSFRGDWGFVNSEAFAGDLFLGMKHNQHLNRAPSANDAVQFRVSASPGEKPEAVEVQFLDES